MGCSCSADDLPNEHEDLFPHYKVIPQHVKLLLCEDMNEYKSNWNETLIYDNHYDSKLFILIPTLISIQKQQSEIKNNNDGYLQLNSHNNFNINELVAKKKKLGVYYNWNKVFREITIVQNCDVISYNKIFYDQRQNEIIYIMPKLRYNLLQYKKRHFKLNEINAKIGLFQLLFQLHNLHKIGYCHCDLKLANILIDTHFNNKNILILKLIDFDHICPLYQGAITDSEFQITHNDKDKAFISRQMNKGIYTCVFIK